MPKENETIGALRALMRAAETRKRSVPLPVVEVALSSAPPQGVRPSVFDANADPRSPFNQRRHIEAPPHDGPKLTPARCAQRRAKLYAACPCRLCALALNPPTTFAEHEALGLGPASFASARRIMRRLALVATAPRPLTRRMALFAEAVGQ